MNPQPRQPLEIDSHGVPRFRRNSIVRALLDAASAGRKLDLNAIACMDFPREDRVQLAQLIGYSLAGFGELSYVDDSDWMAVNADAEPLFLNLPG